MDIVAILLAGIVVGIVGIFIGLFLGFFREKFKIEVDEKEEAVLAVLPGNNCGGCGYPGCSGLAAAIAKGEAPVNQCPVGGEPVAKKVSEIMGVEETESVKMAAFVKCNGTCDHAKQKYAYSGVETCGAMKYLPGGGPKACKYGCDGFGACVAACPFDAIHVVDGVAVVDTEACKACGKCVAACPKHLIELIPANAKYVVQCSSKDKGKEVMAVCDTGCIACHLCEKNCKFDAVHVENDLASIDQSKCKQCGACAAKCPKKIILKKEA